jgi:transcriptional adapter 2-alpha
VKLHPQDFAPMDFVSFPFSRGNKNAASGDNSEETGAAGQGTSEGGKRALYHCNYCNKDITGKICIKCAVCPDFDLCIECFSVGAEVQPHKSKHPYRVMDNLFFPLISADWNADDEILLLEGIERYVMGNWEEVSKHVGTKDKEKCIEHYWNVYLNSPVFPLPDMSHVVGKNKKELLPMAKGQGEDKDKKGLSTRDHSINKEESPFSPATVKIEDSHKTGSSSRLTSNLNSETYFGPSVNTNATTAAFGEHGKLDNKESNAGGGRSRMKTGHNDDEEGPSSNKGEEDGDVDRKKRLGLI